MPSSSSEKFTVPCPQCGEHVYVTLAHVGKKGRCPTCATVFPIALPSDDMDSTPNDDLLPLNDLQSQLRGTSFDRAEHSIWHTIPPSSPPAPSVPYAAPFSAIPSSSQATYSPYDGLRLQDSAPPSTSLAQDYMHRARTEKSLTEQQEDEPGFRFWKSYGSVIGGTLMLCFGLFFILPLALLLGTGRGVYLGITLIIGGGSWLIAGLNYVSYYSWKDRR